MLPRKCIREICSEGTKTLAINSLQLSDNKAMLRSNRRESIGTITVEQAIYYLALFIYVLSTVWNRITFSAEVESSMMILLQGFDLLAAFLLVIKLIYQGVQSVKQFLLISLLVCFGALSWIETESTAMFWLSLLIASGKNMKLRGISRTIFFGLLVSFLAAILGLGLGLVSDHIDIRNGITRLSLGFSHPNYLGVVCYSLCLTFCLSGFTKSRTLLIGLCSILSFVVFYFADTRTGLFSILVFLAFVVLWPVFQRGATVRLKRPLAIAAALLTIYSLVTMVIYTPSNGLLSAINDAMTGRLYCANHFFNLFPTTLFGRTIDDASVYAAGGWFSFMVDNAYCHLLIRYGVVALFALILGFALYYRRELRSPSLSLAYYLLPTALITGLSEATVLLVANNPLLLLLIPVFHSVPTEQFDDTEHALQGARR